MAITYTWEVTSIKTRNVNDFTNAIVQTYWKKIGTDENGNTGTFSGATPFDADTIDPDNFTAFDQLTEEMVLGWIQAVVVGSYEEHVNAQIKKQIDEQASPISETDRPWAVSETSEG
jgi:hypothetical protein